MIEQAEWLEKTFQDNPNNWTIIAFHHPVFSSVKKRDNAALRDLWKPIFDKHQVDLVLQGHDHIYARGRNLRHSLNIFNKESGTMYVTSVSGPKMYRLRSTRWMDRAGENLQLFQVISVTQDILHFKALTVTGELYDSFDLIKQEGAQNLLVERISSGIPERTFESIGGGR